MFDVHQQKVNLISESQQEDSSSDTLESFVIEIKSEDRYDRLNLIDWWAQTKLRTSSVLVVGAGALGNEVLKNLALVGIGKITLIDFDTISIHNLTRSILFRESDVGSTKSSCVGQSSFRLISTLNTFQEFKLKKIFSPGLSKPVLPCNSNKA